MEKEFIPYEQALALKELGFDEHYELLGSIIIYRNKNLCMCNDGAMEMFKGFGDELVTALSYSQAFRWFREKHKLHSTITSISQESWQWHITKPGESLGKLYDEDFYTYEEAELACLNKLIELIKTK
jgi:hypothetical protein